MRFLTPFGMTAHIVYGMGGGGGRQSRPPPPPLSLKLPVISSEARKLTIKYYFDP